MGVKDRSFWKGVNRTAVPSMQEVMESELAQRLFKSNRQLINIEEQEADRMETKRLQESLIIDPDLTTEEKMPWMQQFEQAAGDKTGLSKDMREKLSESVRTFKENKKTRADTTESDRKALALAEAEVNDEYQAQLGRIAALPDDQRSRFQHYQTVEKPTKGKLNALKDDLKLYFEESKAGRTFENQLKLKEVGAKSGGGGGKPSAAERPKTSTELLDKAYQDYRASMKDAEELEMIAKLVGSDTPAGVKRSFREYLSEWLPNAGRVFNAEVADSMINTLNGAQPVAGASGGGTTSGANAPAASGAQVPEDLVERARRALESIEKEIQAFGAKR